MQLVGKELLFVEYFQKYGGHGHLWTIHCFFGVLTSGKFHTDELESYSLDKRLDISLTHFWNESCLFRFSWYVVASYLFIWQILKQWKDFIFISDLFPLTILKNVIFPFLLISPFQCFTSMT